MQRIKAVFLPIFYVMIIILCNLSCQKELSIDVNRKLRIKDKFFEHSDKTDKLILRIIDEIKNRNNTKEFVSDFAMKNGFAVWEKPIISFPYSKSASFKNFTHSNIEEPARDTFAYIPIVLENTDRVNGFILAKINNSVELLYSLAQDYKAFNFEISGDLNDATKFVITNLLLNKEVFGVSDYKIIDYRLFSPDSLHEKLVTLEAVLSAPNCIFIYWPSGQYNSNGEPIINSFEICISSNTVNWPPEGIGISSPGGISGGGGASIPHYYPCISGSNTSTTTPCPEPGPGSGWTPHVIVNSPIIECEILQQAGRKLDSLYSNGRVDSVLMQLPSGWQSQNIEYGFSIIKKYVGIAQQPGQINITGYYPTAIASGTGGHVQINFSYPYNSTPAGWVHTHTDSGYSAQSAFDIYALIRSDSAFRHTDVKRQYEGNIVLSYDSSQYAISVTNQDQALIFLNTQGQYLDGDKWNEQSPIGKAFKDAFDYYQNKVFYNNANRYNLAYEMAMAAVLNQFNTGVTLFKKNSNGNFKPIVVYTTTPDASKPKKKKYFQDCQ